MRIDEERALVEGLARMDGDAWRQFVRLYWRPLAAYVSSRFACGIEACEEITQMTFIRCVKSIGTFDRSRGSLLGWLKAVAANEGHTLARERSRTRELPVSSASSGIAAVFEGAMDKQPLPDEAFERKDFQLAVDGCVDSLEPHYQTALLMRYAEGRSIAELAANLDVSEKAAERLLSRARRALRSALRRRLGGGLEALP